jgi:uncharacterized protein YlxW (UPF0749 family)
MKYKTWLLFGVSVLFGFLLVTQYQSYLRASEEMGRSSSLNYVSQLKLLLQSNEQLKGDLDQLQIELDSSRSVADDEQLAQNEIDKYRLLTGIEAIQGPGIRISLNLELEQLWIVDLVNELYLAGAQGVSLNGMRLVGTEGLQQVVNQGQTNLKLGKTELKKPYIIEAIGEPTTLYNYLTNYDSILKRIQSNFASSAAEVVLSKENGLEMAAVKQ